MITSAEVCLGIAQIVLIRKNEIDDYTNLCAMAGTGVDIVLARTKLALDFSKMPKGFQLRALVEEWDMKRLVQEMY